MRFLLYGAGALGQALGCMLATDGHQVDLILRKRFINAIDHHGLEVTGIFGKFTSPPERIALFPHISQTTAQYDYTLITTKSYDTETALKDLATIAERAGNVVSMQNGCGNVEQVENCFGRERSLGARVITGFEIKEVGSVNITVSADDIHVGASRSGTIPETASLLAKAISDAGHPCKAVDDIHQSLFAKLLYNCALNPLGAILGVHYGALAESSDTRIIMDMVIDETFNVIKALGGTTPWPNAKEYKTHFYKNLIPVTYSHRPSMLQDLENNKPTEVDSLVGYVGKQGRLFNIPTKTAPSSKLKESTSLLK